MAVSGWPVTPQRRTGEATETGARRKKRNPRPGPTDRNSAQGQVQQVTRSTPSDIHQPTTSKPRPPNNQQKEQHLQASNTKPAPNTGFITV